MHLRILAGVLVLAGFLVSCTSSVSDTSSVSTSKTPVPTTVQGKPIDFEEPPNIPEGPLSDRVEIAIEQIFGPTLDDRIFDVNERAALDVLGNSGDVRVAWLFSDLLRFVFGEDTRPRVIRNGLKVAELSLQPQDDWQRYTDHLIAWDVPAPPGYLEAKKRLYTLVEPAWEPLFDETSEVDWRYVTWGGVLIDDRAFGDTERCSASCIPAADNPATTEASGGDWYPDDRIVFGVEINGEARAYPKHIMEIREMVNDTLGGRDFGMPYCTLCGSAQVFLTDETDGFARPVLRTSGLLSRSNKVMYDLNTKSVFDTFLGTAVTGPMADAGVTLSQVSVATTTWGAWKADHPKTTIMAEGLDFDNPNGFDPLRGRDDNGPIFPVGDVDPRLPVQEAIFGVISPDTARPIAVHVAIAIATLQNGESIEVEGIAIKRAGSGLVAIDGEGNDLGGHQAFWFAWSQFHPDTDIWPSG
jgi:hypothetical protein